MVIAAAGAAVVVGGIASSSAQKSAAGKAANAQTTAANQAINAENERFYATQQMLQPYVTGGTEAFGQQQTLAGVNGADAQQSAINALQASPAYTSALKTGENSILQNASATGGLRGGNTQAALAQYSPALLASTINDQYARLGGLSSMGLGAATQTGQFGQNATNNVSNLLQQSGAATAGGYVAAGKADAGFYNSISSIGGAYLGKKF